MSDQWSTNQQFLDWFNPLKGATSPGVDAPGPWSATHLARRDARDDALSGYRYQRLYSTNLAVQHTYDRAHQQEATDFADAVEALVHQSEREKQ